MNGSYKREQSTRRFVYAEVPRLDTLTAERLHLFVEKIVVGGRGKKWSHTAAREIHSCYRGIGLLGDLAERTTDNAIAQQPREAA